MRVLPTPPLLVVTDRGQLAGGAEALGELAEAIFTAGCRWISLREKDLAPEEQARLARDLKRRAAPHGATVTLHGSPEAALRAGVDGVHLPEAADASAARRLLGPDVLIGQSVHAPGQALAIDPALVDYVVAGPFQATASKPGYGPVLGEAGLAAIVQASPVPVVAIGGIEAQDAPSCLAAGAAGIAAMGTVMRAARPEAVIAALLDGLRNTF